MIFLSLSPETMQMITKLTVATLLGMLIGFERERRGKPAGLRTYTLVTLGSALFTILSLHGAAVAHANAYDPSRIASQVVVGIGFIGAGLIFFKEDSIYGLTTAAGLWASAAVGMTVGFGFYAVAIYAAVVVLLILWLFRYLDSRISKTHH